MEIPSIIVTALVLGATAGIKGIAEQSVKDAYIALTHLIKTKYQGQINLELLEKSPDSISRQEVLREDVISSGADKDKEILIAVASLLDILTISKTSPSFPEGVSLEDVQALNIKIKDIVSEGGGIAIRHAKVKGDIQIESVVSGKKKQKKRRI
ncbi:MAG: hypothetical protein KGZ86_07575 [Candidatus Latescibacteria bacterium]|nr:hypothetical protein [Candidatus Latescibacterota bacterium]